MTYTARLLAQGISPIAGVDEAGRGACAGPITIAACILPVGEMEELRFLDDSKKLTPKRREALFEVLTATSTFSVVWFSAEEIDRMGIHVANVEGMRLAVEGLSTPPAHVLTDAWRVEGLTLPHTPIVGGDGVDRSIAAASVIAKVSRDRHMRELAQTYPEYGLEKHKGYSTRAHLDAVRHHGASPIHRYTYSNVVAADTEFRFEQQRKFQ